MALTAQNGSEKKILQSYKVHFVQNFSLLQ